VGCCRHLLPVVLSKWHRPSCKQALAQVDSYLRRLGVVKEAVDDTAGAAMMVARQQLQVGVSRGDAAAEALCVVLRARPWRAAIEHSQLARQLKPHHRMPSPHTAHKHRVLAPSPAVVPLSCTGWRFWMPTSRTPRTT
jgi:hypothetical protein